MLRKLSRWWYLNDYYENGDEMMPERAGVYAIYLDGELSYIGSSVDLHQRISSYGIKREGGFPRDPGFRTPWGTFGHVAIKYRLCRQYGEWLAIEARLIRRLSPRLNSCYHARKGRDLSAASIHQVLSRGLGGRRPANAMFAGIAWPLASHD